MSEYLIIRHARSCYNIRQTKDLNSELTEFGKIQASGVGKFLVKSKDFNFNNMMWGYHTSPFKRCLMTSQLINNELNRNIKFLVNENISEWLDLEDSSTRSVSIPSKKPEFIKDFVWSGYNEKEFKSESNADFLKRIYKFLELTELYPRNLIVTHGLPALTLIKAITENINYVPVWDFSIDNASITWIKDKRIIWHGRNLHHEEEAENQRQLGQNIIP